MFPPLTSNNSVISGPSFPGSHLHDENILSLNSQMFLQLLHKKVNFLKSQKTFLVLYTKEGKKTRWPFRHGPRQPWGFWPSCHVAAPAWGAPTSACLLPPFLELYLPTGKDMEGEQASTQSRQETQQHWRPNKGPQ